MPATITITFDPASPSPPDAGLLPSVTAGDLKVVGGRLPLTNGPSDQGEFPHLEGQPTASPGLILGTIAAICSGTTDIIITFA